MHNNKNKTLEKKFDIKDQIYPPKKNKINKIIYMMDLFKKTMKRKINL